MPMLFRFQLHFPRSTFHDPCSSRSVGIVGPQHAPLQMAELDVMMATHRCGKWKMDHEWLVLGKWLVNVANDIQWWWMAGEWWLMMVNGWWMMVDEGWWWSMVNDGEWWWMMVNDGEWWWMKRAPLGLSIGLVALCLPHCMVRNSARSECPIGNI